MAYPEYSNIEVFQGEDFEMTVDLSSDTAYSFTNKSFKAQLAADYDSATTRVAFTISDEDSSAKTMKLKLSRDQTQSLADDFDGYWDLMGKEINTAQVKVTGINGSGGVTVLSITVAGTGYIVAPTILLIGGSGSLARISIDTINGVGSIGAVTATQAGSGYVINELLSVAGGGKYTRLLQGEAKVFPQITKDEDFA